MSKAVKRVAIALVFTIVLTLGIASAVFADTNYWDNCGNLDHAGIGPAPNFGDGIPDGPGW